MTTSTSGALTQTTSGTLAPTAIAPAATPMLHKGGYFTAAYAIVFGGLLLYVLALTRRFPATDGAKKPHS